MICYVAKIPECEVFKSGRKNKYFFGSSIAKYTFCYGNTEFIGRAGTSMKFLFPNNYRPNVIIAVSPVHHSFYSGQVKQFLIATN